MNEPKLNPEKLALWQALKADKPIEKKLFGAHVTVDWQLASSTEVCQYLFNSRVIRKYHYRVKPEHRVCWLAFSRTGGAVFIAHSKEEKATVEEVFYITSSGWHKVEDK